MRYVLTCFLIILIVGSVTAQDPVVNKMKLYKAAKLSSLLYLHFDKNVYAGAETAWFTGYIFNEPNDEVYKSRYLEVILVRNADTTVVMEDKFLIENGIVKGAMQLPDSLLAGEYHFAAYSDLLINNKPSLLFNQPITIITSTAAASRQSAKVITKLSHQAKAIVNFYPEGGNLLEGLTSVVGWEVKDDQNNFVPGLAYLYCNDKIIDTIETSSSGMGHFILRPAPNSHYHIQLLQPLNNGEDYSLPLANTAGVVIELSKAVVQDTLRIKVLSKFVDKAMLRIHNFQNIFWAIPLKLSKNEQYLEIPLSDLPKGLATVTITDSLERPLAERMFFAHYPVNDEPVVLTTDKKVYKKREKVVLKLRLKNGVKNAMLSLAAVASDRLLLKNLTDIANYIYLDAHLANLPAQIDGNKLGDQSYMEDILLIKGWTRYKWTELNSVVNQDTLHQFKNLSIQVDVAKSKRNVRKPMKLGFVGGLSPTAIEVGLTDNYIVPVNQLLAEQGNKVKVINLDDNHVWPAISIRDPFPAMNETIKSQFQMASRSLRSSLSTETRYSNHNNDKTHQLKEVVITSRVKKNRPVSGFTNECGDWVCLNNILNCPNHPGTPPVIGQYYYTQAKGLSQYLGCNLAPQARGYTELPSIHIDKEFYIDNHPTDAEPSMLTTLCWKFGILLSEGKEEIVEFYTGDIIGHFTVNIQGITESDVFSTKLIFEVE